MKTETAFEKLNSWIKRSVTLKLVTITILMLLLLIPVGLIKSIITERESLQRSASYEVSSKWAENQLIKGPILTIPFVFTVIKDDNVEEYTDFFHILPDMLEIKGDILPEVLHRGIYDIVVYNSELSVSGNFILDKIIDHKRLKKIEYDKAFLTMGVSDLRGFDIDFTWDQDKITAEPGSKIEPVITSGVTLYIPDLSEQDGQSIDFSINLKFRGSKNLSFLPLGKTTFVELKSNWPDPKFDGNQLPTFRNVTDSGFTANWKVPHYVRNNPQTSIGSEAFKNMNDSAFGVDLIIRADNYQKSLRSAKYGVMSIALTFLIFFLVEIINRRKIHPFQYALVGLAISLFYVLLVSISEHTSFNIAYLIASLSIITMITLYSLTVFKAIRLSFLLLSILLSIYGFMFVTLQLTDWALLIGSIGLTIMLAATMYFTRKINWYKVDIENE